MPRARIAVVVVVIVLVGIIGYAVVGYAFASTQVANADRSLHTVVSHKDSLNSTFMDIGGLFNGLFSSSTTNPTPSRARIDLFMANARVAGTTVDQDDASLVSARAQLHSREWLTAFSRADLDQEAARTDHARKGLSNARSIAADYVKDGEFFQAFADVSVDFDAFITQVEGRDISGAKASLPNLKMRLDKALQLSKAPGLPGEIHSLMFDFQTLAADYGTLLDALAANDKQAIVRAGKSVEGDGTKLSAYDLTKVDIFAYYKPRVDAFNSEMAKATAA
ncbi:MAG TPA: hypothetical protein VIO37_04405 [Candidatus Dormibacteraeota bacterium]